MNNDICCPACLSEKVIVTPNAEPHCLCKECGAFWHQDIKMELNDFDSLEWLVLETTQYFQ